MILIVVRFPIRPDGAEQWTPLRDDAPELSGWGPRGEIQPRG